MKITDQRGSALYIVLLFSVIALATVSVHVFQQFNVVKISRSDPAKLQALLNARSGIWYGLAMLDREVDLKKNMTDSADSVLPALFGEDMFQPDIFSEKEETDEVSKAPSESPQTITLFDELVSFTYQLMPSIYFRILKCDGTFREHTRSVITTVASKPFVNPDTVIFLETPGVPEGGGLVSGRIMFTEKSIDNSDSIQSKRFFVDLDALRKISDGYQQALSSLSDSVIRNPPLVIQYSDDLAKMPDTVAGPLFIDGTNRDVELKARRIIVVLEDLQITGSVSLEDLTFVVGGDIKILDKAEIRSVDLYTTSRIFFAGESYFRGNALAGGDIEIYETAIIDGKSLLIAADLGKKTQQTPIPVQTNQTGIPPNPIQIEQQGGALQQQTGTNPVKNYILFVRDEAIVDGILIDLNPQGGIFTDARTLVRGVLWAENRVCHRGQLQGIIKAKILFDDTALGGGMNFMSGSVKELDAIATYCFPFFIGVPTLIDWKEL